MKNRLKEKVTTTIGILLMAFGIAIFVMSYLKTENIDLRNTSIPFILGVMFLFLKSSDFILLAKAIARMFKKKLSK